MQERHMTKPRPKSAELIGSIQPDVFYRTNLSPQIFGYGPEATRAKIRSGELPMPLSASSRFEAWTGQQILKHREDMLKIAVEKSKVERPKQEQPKGLAEHQRVKKQKLQPPAPRKAKR
jgi:hypothetical protein